MPNRQRDRDPMTDAPLPQCEVPGGAECPNASVLREIRSELRLLNHHITGNGTPERGVLIRLDRAEQRIKLLWTALLVAVLALCGLGWKVVQGKGGSDEPQPHGSARGYGSIQ